MQLVISVLAYVVKLEFMDGYRTYAAGVASLLAGLSLLAFAFAGDPRGDVKGALEAIVAGVTIIGAAGKADKMIRANGRSSGPSSGGS